MVHMRWRLVALLVLACSITLSTTSSASAASGLPLWGCCVPDTMHECYDGSINDYTGTAHDFALTCRNDLLDKSIDPVADPTLGGHLVGGVASCNTLFAAGGRCEIGCCCETGASPVISQKIGRNACSALNTIDDPWAFHSLAAGKTCDQVCGSSGTVQPPVVHTVKGTVVRKGTLQGLPAEISVVGTAIAAKAGTDGAFQLSGVPEGKGYFLAVPVSPAPASCRLAEIVQDVTADITNLKIEVDCTPAGCANPAPVMTAPVANVGTDSVSFKVTMAANTCGNMPQLDVRRYIKQPSGALVLDAVVTSTTEEYTDHNVPENAELCYTATAIFLAGSPLSTSATQCVKTGDVRCMVTPNKQWCGGADVHYFCDQNNRVNTEDCAAGGRQSVCIQSGATSAACVDAPSCKECNGLIGMFSKLPLSIKLAGASVSCRTLVMQGRCYLDSVRTYDAPDAPVPVMVNAYNSCVGISGCGAYASKAACEANACKVTADGAIDRCQWVDLN